MPARDCARQTFMTETTRTPRRAIPARVVAGDRLSADDRPYWSLSPAHGVASCEPASPAQRFVFCGFALIVVHGAARHSVSPAT